MVKLEDIVAAVSLWCPDVVVNQDKDGNITLNLNMQLDEDGEMLINFYDEYDAENEDA